MSKAWDPIGVHGLNPEYFDFEATSPDFYEKLQSKLRELPKEWYTVQITASYQRAQYPSAPPSTCPIHLTVLPTGPNALSPFTILLPKPKNPVYDVVASLQKLLANNKTDLQREYKYNSQYWKMREEQDKTMKTGIEELENNWLREWRILLIADPITPSYTTKDSCMLIDKLIADEGTVKLTDKQIWLLKKIATCCGYLDKIEITRAVQFVIGDYKKFTNNVILSILAKKKLLIPGEDERRKTLVLIVDEFMDFLPFESMSILDNHPVTRFPCLHIAYALFKEHEDTIVDGCKEIIIDDKSGLFLVNPSSNLELMEKRIRAFMNYWLPNWQSIFNRVPTEDELIDGLKKHKIFMYNGHGSGLHYITDGKIEKTRINTVPLLFGCSSAKLLPIGGRYPPHGPSNQYLTACSPCLLGMLWEVTDLITDKMTAKLISRWIPSHDENKEWKNVDQTQWNKGVVEFKKSRKRPESLCDNGSDREMSRALAYCKYAFKNQWMSASAAITRGLPVRIKKKEE